MPGPQDTAVLGGSTPYVVTIDESIDLGTLDLSNEHNTAGLTAGHTLSLGMLSGAGLLVVNSDGLLHSTILRLDDDSVIAARVILNSPPDAPVLSAGRVLASGVGNATIGSRGVVTGRGSIGGRLTNDGLILAEGVDGSVRFASAIVTHGPEGVVSVRDGGRIILASGSRITGGRWIAPDDGDPGIVDSSSWSNVISDAAFEGVWGMPEGTNLTLGGRCNGSGTLEVRATPSGDSTSLFLGPDAVLDLPVVFRSGWLNQDHAFFSTIGSRAVLTGSTFIQGDHFVQGVFSPGIGTETFGLFSTANGNIRLLDDAILHMDIGGPERDQHDLIRWGRYSLGGTLRVNFNEGYVPQASDRYDIIQSSIDGGRFAHVEIENMRPDVGPPHVVYDQRRVAVVICAADRDGDGQLTIFDYLAYQNQFDAGDLQADLDGDHDITLFDFMVFQTRFDAGCD